MENHAPEWIETEAIFADWEMKYRLESQEEWKQMEHDAIGRNQSVGPCSQFFTISSGWKEVIQKVFEGPKQESNIIDIWKQQQLRDETINERMYHR